MWLSSDWLVLRLPGGVPGISGISLPVPARRGPSACVTIPHLKLPFPTWAPIEELRDTCQIFLDTLSGRARSLFYLCAIVSWLPFLCFCIPSLPLVTVWICPLQLRGGVGGWSLFAANKKQKSFGSLLPVWRLLCVPLVWTSSWEAEGGILKQIIPYTYLFRSSFPPRWNTLERQELSPAVFLPPSTSWHIAAASKFFV